MPKLKNPTVIQLKKILWRIVSPYIRQRDNYTCFTCGEKLDKYNSHAGHFIPHGSYSDTDFDETNLHCQCIRCNKFLSGNLMEYTLKMIKMYGKKHVEDLRRRKHIVKKWTKEELKELIEYYKIKLAELDR